MAFQTCWRCLSRIPSRALSSQPLISNTPSAATFTTSASLQALSKKRQSKPDLPEKQVSRTFIKKGRNRKADSKSKKPAIGERKALRKRIVLSNFNALEVQDLKDVAVESMSNEDMQGHVFGIPEPLVDQLRVVEAFKVYQGWRLYRRPAMLVRREMIEYGKLMDDIGEEDGTKHTVRRVLVGERGSGKSIMLLQAMAAAFLKGWVVINLPDAKDLVIGHTEYGPIPGTTPALFNQKVYTASLLSAISRANPVLSTLTLTIPPPKTPTPIPPSIPLSQFCNLGTQDAELSLPIFQTLLQELLLPSRPPLLLCIDNLAHAMQNSAYRTAAFEPIHAHDLYLVNWFLGHLSGITPLPNGGLVLAATSASNNPIIPSLDLALSDLESPEEPIGPPPYPASYKPRRNPFATYDRRVLDVFENRGIEVQRLKGLSKEEARELMAYWARSGMLRQKLSNGLVGEKWALSGGGIVGELERATVRMRI